MAIQIFRFYEIHSFCIPYFHRPLNVYDFESYLMIMSLKKNLYIVRHYIYSSVFDLNTARNKIMLNIKKILKCIFPFLRIEETFSFNVDL